MGYVEAENAWKAEDRKNQIQSDGETSGVYMLIGKQPITRN